MGKTILITGGGGYIGCVLAARLLQRGDRVKLLDRFFWGRTPLAHLTGDRELIAHDVRSFPGDVLDGVDAVAHLAGLSNDPTAEYNPHANWEMNAVATDRLGRLCKERGVRRLIYGSSCSIYDGLGHVAPLDETAEVHPVGAYATSKYFGEQRLREMADERFCPVIFRQGTVYGYSPRMRFDLVVNTFVKDAVLHGKLFLHGGGWVWRPLVDVEDVAEAHIRAIDESDEDKLRGQIFNVIEGNYQIRQLAMLVAGSLKLRGLEVALESAPMPKINRNYRCSGRKFADTFGFVPGIGPLQSIETMLDRLDLTDRKGLTHPRHYNIQWMTMLEEASEILGTLSPFDEPCVRDREREVAFSG
jgi:nucleoside-diphosphate-sugar epimerase